MYAVVPPNNLYRHTVEHMPSADLPHIITMVMLFQCGAFELQLYNNREMMLFAVISTLYGIKPLKI